MSSVIKKYQFETVLVERYRMGGQTDTRRKYKDALGFWPKQRTNRQDKRAKLMLIVQEKRNNK